MAIKLLRPELAHDRQVVHRFLVEARHMRQLEHPHILPVVGVFEPPQNPGYVAPFMAGGSLGMRLVPGEPAPPEMILTIARQIGSALAYAHGKGIIHRDLKPANVLLDESGSALLCDFGLVRTVFNDTVADVSRGHREGTAAYMSPAVARGEAEDTRCDIYSFGAMPYEMLAGGPPYEGRGTEQILQRVIAGPPEPILRRNSAAPAGLVRIAEGCMARELRDRYAQMSDVLADLERVQAGEAPIGPHGPLKQRKTWGKTGAGIVAAAVVLLASAALIAVWRFAKPTVDVATHPILTNPSVTRPATAPTASPSADTRPADASKLAQHIAQMARSQAELVLDDLPVTNADLAPLEHAPRVTVLSLRHAGITDAGLSHLKNLSSLRELNLGETKVTGSGLGWIAGLKNLQRLILSGCAIDDAGLTRLRDMQNLDTLGLGHTQVTDSGMRTVAGMTHLHGLDLCGLRISDDGMQTLRGLKAMEALALRDTRVSDRGVRALQDMQRLAWVDLQGTRVTGRGFASLSKLTALRTILLDGSRFEGSNSSSLAVFVNLGVLTLSKTSTGDEDLEPLRALPNLEHLSLGDTRVTDAGMAYLEPLLNLAGLDLSTTGVGDEGMVHLRGLAQLSDLNLDHTRISDAGLGRLSGLHRLRRLSIVGDEVSDAAIANLQRELPACAIHR